MKEKEYDLIVIGGGPAGYYGALRGAQLGAKVAVVEMGDLGGTCLNCGCIPTKTLLEVAELRQKMIKSGELGLILPGPIDFDISKIHSRKESIVRSLQDGIASLLRAKRIELLRGKAKFIDRSTVRVLSDMGEQILSARKILIATGSSEKELSIPGGNYAIGSRRALAFDSVPLRTGIIGGGAVGLELATLYSGLGSKVTVLEFMPEILPSEDHETVSLLRNLLNQSGIAIKTSCSVTEIRKDNEEYIIDYECDGKTAHDVVDLVITAVGRVPYTDDLNLDGIGVELDDKGFIRTNNFLETTAQGVYAAGDVIGGMLLAHVAFAEGKTAVENALEEKKPHEAISVPRCIFTHPEFSAVGLTEEAVQNQGLDYRVGRFSLRGNGRAVSLGQNQGLVKVIVDSQIGQILGVSIVGPCASEMIASASYLIEEEFTCSELGTTMIAHPTLGEALKEAGLDCYGLAIHK